MFYKYAPVLQSAIPNADVHTCLFTIFDEKLKQIAEGNCANLLHFKKASVGKKQNFSFEMFYLCFHEYLAWLVVYRPAANCP